MSEEIPRTAENPPSGGFGTQSEVGALGRPGSTRAAAVRLLTEEAEGIPGHAAWKLVGFLEVLRAGRIETLGTRQKTTLFECLLDLWTHRNRESIARVCGLFFDGMSHAAHPAALPEGMIEAMIQAGRAERSERVKEKIWDVLMKSVPELHKRISPSDLVFGLWLDHPVFRGNIIRYLFAHFPAEAVLEAMKGPSGDTGKGPLPFPFLPVSNAMRLLKEKPWILAEILHCTRLDPDDRERFHFVLVATLSRFDLLRVLPHLPKKPMGVKETSSQGGQRCLQFPTSPGWASVDPRFGSRVRALKALTKRPV